MSLDKLFKHVGLYDDWKKEKLQEKYQAPLTDENRLKSTAFFHENKPILSYDTDIFNQIPSIGSMEPWETARSYLTARKIPEDLFDKLFYVGDFKRFTNSLIPGKFDDLLRDEGRLIIPFFDEKKKIFAYAGRSLDKFSELRYINIVLDESKPKIFGLERWDDTKSSILVEGPFDSLFLNNGLAAAGGDIVSALEGLLEIRKSSHRQDFTICYDNEPRSISTKKKIQKAIDHGFKVCIWPSNLKFKDINEMILDGYSQKNIEIMINTHSYQGLQAEVELAFWSKR